MAIQEGAGNVPQQTFVQWNDPQGTELVGINRDGTVFAQGLTFPDGTTISTVAIPGAVAIPIIQARLDVLDTTATHSISHAATVTTMFTISVFLESEGDGQNTDAVVATLTFTDPSSPSDTHTFTCNVHGGAGENIVMETYPVLVEVGTVINFSTAFSAGVMTYDLGVRLVQMP